MFLVSVDIESVETVIIAKKVIVHSPQDGTTNVLSAGGKHANLVRSSVTRILYLFF